MRIILTFLLLSFFSIHSWGQKTTLVENLRCEHLENPLGVDSPRPRLAWMLSDAESGANQLAYQIVVSADSANVVKGTGDVWDSGRVASDAIFTLYKGRNLKPFTKYFWAVTVWNQANEKSTSTIATFETGMMGIENWKGSWISDHSDKNEKAAPYFRKEFKTEKKIKSARAYMVAAGLYELYINGEKVGNHRLDPMYTRFDRRNLYVTYYVTDQLQNGRNAIGVLLGNGWYNHQSLGVWDFHNAPWRNRPAFCLDLRITYEDGSVETIVSERDWKTSNGGVVFNSIYTAEHYDARKEQHGWNRPGFDDSKWHGVKYRATPSQNIVSQLLHPIRNVEEIVPQQMIKINDTTYLYDLGRNIAGVSQIRVTGDEGTIIKLKHTERLSSDGRADGSNIDVYYRGDKATDPFQTDIFILSGRGEEQFMPKFSYKGFRYVEVSSSHPIDLKRDNLTGYFMHSDVPSAGTIEASNPLINKLWWATNNSYLSNLFGYPTDCPQREKNGWTGDAHFAIETGLYNFDGITIYEKWLADHRDEQQPNGVLPDIIPTGGWGYGTDNGVDWTSTIAIIPWNIYLYYGDSKLLADCYHNIKRYVNYIDSRSPEGLTSWGRGDWVPVKSQSTKELMSSIYYYVDTKILADAAKLFGKQDDYNHYSALAQKIKRSINTKYLNKETGIYANGTQTEQSMPLMWDVVPADMRQLVADNLAKKVEENGYHLDVGVHGAKALLFALSENGHAEAAYKVAVQDEYPSWGWWIENGATTLLENWDLEAERDISDNHMMFGAVGGWFYRGLGGIYPDENKPGFKNVILRPNFISSLENIKVTHQSPYGEIISSWQHKGKGIDYTVTIPANSFADFYVPAGYSIQKASDAISGKKINLTVNESGLCKLQAGSYIIELK
ncbi:family 78 glycoside hydrolase catalytic domain [uncultured Draconibacterium sp.]|uniref:alpha-L-rhamnosidase n=1 Tax=uncultured Draconibacterium sp. TaxID=1573823 RepID=UPI0029C77CE3|nr:family 78 glycoside hydrolase catalytic domain [uncultured Draconibacterium sp.]